PQMKRAVITATPMMQTINTTTMPTRAEYMHVANPVVDGTAAFTYTQLTLPTTPTGCRYRSSPNQ
ncbi:pyruvate kinase, partial [Enterobacter intestinihominis]